MSSPSGSSVFVSVCLADVSPAPSSSAPSAATVPAAATAALVARAAVPRVATTFADAIAAALVERTAAGSFAATSAGAVSPAKATLPTSVNGAVGGVATSVTWPGSAAGVPTAVLASVTLAAPFTTPPGFLPALRSVAAAPASADEPRKAFGVFASPDRGLAAVRAFPRLAAAAPPGDALLLAVCTLRPTDAAGVRRAAVLSVFLPLASAGADLGLPRPGAFAVFRCALPRPLALPSVPFVLADTAARLRVLTTPAAFLRAGALLAPVPVDGLAAGFRAPAGVVRGLRAPLVLATDPTRFVTAFEVRVLATFLRVGALLVLALADDLLAAFRVPTDVARALPAPLFLAAEPVRFVAALGARVPATVFRAGAALLDVVPAALVRRPGPEATWIVALLLALFAPVLVRVGLL
jgi:hypothetical protein